MTKPKILLFLHGVGDGDPGNAWRDTLTESLQSLGYPDLSEVMVIAPKYPKGLRGVDDEVRLPKVMVKSLRGDEARTHRRDFERRRSAMEALLGDDDDGTGLRPVELALPVALKLNPFVQAEQYLTDPKIRAWVLGRIIGQLPLSGRLVIVGHSLGSVIAADLLRRLPPTLEVTGMVTIGSPLAHRAFHVDDLEDTLADPPANLAWWVNFWSPADLVPARRGVSSVFPWVLDQRLGFALNPVRAHGAKQYLASPKVAEAIGRGLYGSRSKELVLAPKGLDVPIDEAESLALMALRYAHLTSQQLEGDTRSRYEDALRQVQAETFARLAARRRSENRPLPSQIELLAVDLTDDSSLPVMPTPLKMPDLPVHLAVVDAIFPLTVIASGNVLAPFEIEVSELKRQKAMEQLTFDMKLGRKLGRRVFEAMDQADDALKGPTNWVKWAALGLGAAALVAATSGLALAAAPGAAGAAAMTSALAAFGPGGMLGGLLTAGTLVGAGGGSIAMGLAAPSTTAETVEAVVARQLTVAILRRMQGVEQDPQTWVHLAEVERAVRRELARLSVVSDPTAPSVKAMRRKLDALKRALDFLEREGFYPAAASTN